MRQGQGLPVNMIVLVALGLLALVVVGSFFISGFGQASSSVNVVDADQAECQSLCQSLSMIGSNYNTCPELSQNIRYAEWAAAGCASFGDCLVNARRQANCRCNDLGCAGNDEETCDILCGEFQGSVSSPRIDCGDYDIYEGLAYVSSCPLATHTCPVPCSTSCTSCICACSDGTCKDTEIETGCPTP